jgi:methyl coenzyme M reductase subunit D
MGRKRRTNKVEVERAEIAGHVIEIRTIEGKEQLSIDGLLRRILRGPDGYNLYDDAFVRPFPTVMDAAKSYIERQLEASE